MPRHRRSPSAELQRIQTHTDYGYRRSAVQRSPDDAALPPPPLDDEGELKRAEANGMSYANQNLLFFPEKIPLFLFDR
jgi:hypothetical protein